MTKAKLLMIVIGLPLLLVAVFGLGKLIQNTQGKVLSGPEIISPTPFNTNIADAGPTALLTKESGEVQYKLPNTEDFKILETGELNVPTETTIKTGIDSLAHVVFPDNSLMSLSKNTEVILRFEEKKINIFQIFGNTWHRVEKVLQGHEYSVETPTTLATVRGTEFNIGVDDTGAEVYVMESVVDVSKITKVGEEVKIEETQKVTQDKHIFMKDVDAAKPLKVVDLPADKKKSDWFLRNSKLTEQIKKAEVEEEKKEGIVPVTGTPGTTSEVDSEKKDKIKNKIRKEMMESIKENVELKKIDAQFPTSTSSASPQSTKSTRLNTLPAIEGGSQGKVQGINTKNNDQQKDSPIKKEEPVKNSDNRQSEQSTRKDEPPLDSTKNDNSKRDENPLIKDVIEVPKADNKKDICIKEKEGQKLSLKEKINEKTKEVESLKNKRNSDKDVDNLIMDIKSLEKRLQEADEQRCD